MWAFRVLSDSPVSQSQILIDESSLALAITLYNGWKATFVIGALCPVNVCLAGARGSQSIELRIEAGFKRAVESSSSI